MCLPAHASQVLSRTPSFVDLFCGCGGLSWGFQEAGFRSLVAVDIDAAALRTHARNIHGPVWCGPVEQFARSLERGDTTLGPVDVVTGGPPCQGFSPLGRMSAKGPRRARHSDMNQLWRDFLRVVELLQPRVFVTENVPEFIRSDQFECYREEVTRLGYLGPAALVLRADEYGVAQKRRRAICISARETSPFLPPPTGEQLTVQDAIGHLPRRPDGRNWHIGRNPTPKSVERYRAVPPGGNRFDLARNRPDLLPDCWRRKKSGSTDVFGRLTWDGLALTIRTEFYKPEKGTYLHPEEDRPITHREAACLQSFPDTFEFVGSKIQVARQIGEAVPPKLSYEVARAVLALLAEGE